MVALPTGAWSSRSSKCGSTDGVTTLLRYRLARLVLALLLVTVLPGCGGERVAIPFRMHEVVGPTGGDVLAITVAGNGKLVGLTESHLYTWDDAEHMWQGQRAAVAGEFGLPNAPFRSVLLDGLQHNYPRSRLFTSWNGAVWLLARRFEEPILLYTDTAGASWRRVELPANEKPPQPAAPVTPDEQALLTVPPELATEAPTAEEPIRATEPYRLVGDAAGLFLVGTHDIWRFDGTTDEPAWISIGTDGLPQHSTGLPPAIRNYLPASDARPFEMATVLAELRRIELGLSEPPRRRSSSTRRPMRCC